MRIRGTILLMCGRYETPEDKRILAERFSTRATLQDFQLGRVNECSPGSVQPVVLLNDEGEREIVAMRWGFTLPDRFLFLARSEGAATSPFWKEMIQERRCIVPATAFFEWQDTKSGPKPKYKLGLSGRDLFGMAGMWAIWKNPKTLELEPTFAVLTGEANGVMRQIHDRQPVVLDPGDYEEWLAQDDRPPLHLLRILPDEQLTITRLNPVEAVRAESPNRDEPPPAQTGFLFG